MSSTLKTKRVCPSEMLTTRYQITWNMKIHYHENFKILQYSMHVCVCASGHMCIQLWLSQSTDTKTRMGWGLAMHRNQE